MSWKRDGSGALICTWNDIPILDTRVYNVKFSNGHYEKYATNVLTESLTSSYNCDGYDKAAIKEIRGNRKSSNDVDRSNGFYTSKNDNKIPIVTTKGWNIRICWNDDSTTWVTLHLVKKWISFTFGSLYKDYVYSPWDSFPLVSNPHTSSGESLVVKC